MSKVEIYYFSGTGNSLYVAKELKKRIPEVELIPIVSLLGKKVIATDAEMVGFVFPIYMTAVPTPVKNFIMKLDFKSTKYIFAVATRIGTTHRAFICLEKILKKKSKMLDSCFSLNMASNDPKFKYKVPTEKEIAELENVVQNRLDSISKVIINKEKKLEKDTSFTTRIPFLRLISLIVALTEGLKDNLYADSKCTGCGTCERVCLSQKIKMINKKPVWQESVKCYHCSACLNYCPMGSAQIKSYTERNGRYSHPYATIEDIAGQKCI